MAEEKEESFPPDIQILPSQFAFRELHPLKTITSEEQPKYDTIRTNLLAVANIYGYIFVGIPDGLKVFQTSDLLDTEKNGLEKVDAPVASIDLRNPPNWIGVNSDNLTLAVCCKTDRGPQILFFDIRNIINTTKPTKTPFHSLSLNKDPNSYVTSMCWNPSSDWPNLLAICVSSGSFHLLSIESTAAEIAIRPDNFGAATVCWSPKGIQMIVGKRDGTLHQFTQKLEVRRSITVSDVIDRPVRASDILWLSTHQVATAYVESDVEEGMQPNLFLADIPSKNEQRDIKWKNYEDPCFGMNDSRDSQNYFTFLDQWQMFVTLSSNSSDTAIITRNKDSRVWEIWSLDDSGRASLPLSEYTDDDSSPLGAAVITTAKDRIIIDDERECGPMPVIIILTNDGVLCMFHMINLIPEYLSFVSMPQSLDLTRERTIVGNKGAVTGGGDSSKPPISSIKQRLTAKPSMTPKIGSHLPGSSFNTSSLPMPQSVAKSLFSSSTPIVGKPPPFSEGPSIIQGDAFTPQPKPPLMRETLLKASPFALPKHQALDETADSVFDGSQTGSSNSVFPVKVVERKPLPGVQGLIRMPHASPKQHEVTVTKTRVLDHVANVGQRVLPKMPGDAPPPVNFHNADGRQQQLPLTKTKSTFNGGGGRFGSNNRTEAFENVKEVKTQPTAPVPLGRKSSLNYKENDLDLTGTLDDVASFERELREFQASISDTKHINDTLGGNDEKLLMQKEVQSMSSFSKEISKTAQESNNEIQELSTSLLSLISETKDVGRKQNQTSVGAYRSLLYSRPLDRTQKLKMEAINGLYQYVVSCVREANIALDAQWEESNKRRQSLFGAGSTRDNRKGILQLGEWEAAYQGLKNNMKILHNQEMQIMLLSQQLYELRLESASSRSRSEKLSSVSRNVQSSDDLRVLADTLLLQNSNRTTARENKLTDSPKDERVKANRKISPKKQAQLGQILASRKVAPVRSSGRSPSSITRPKGRSSARLNLTALNVKSISSESKTPSESISPQVEDVVEESPESGSASTYEDKTPDSTSSSAPSDKGFMFGDPANQYHQPVQQQMGSGQPKTNDYIPSSAHSSKIPQGSATLAYGAPESLMADTKRRELSSLVTSGNSEAASNLNNPPRVVNIQQLQEPDPVETSLPVKFEPKSQVPPGAVEVVQAVFNTVIAEKQQKPKEWNTGDHSTPTTATKLSATFASTDNVVPGGVFKLSSTNEPQSPFSGNSVYGKPPSGQSSSNVFVTVKESSSDVPSTQKGFLSAKSSFGEERQLFGLNMDADLNKRKEANLVKSMSSSSISQNPNAILRKDSGHAASSSNSPLPTSENVTGFGSKLNPVMSSATTSMTSPFGSKPSTPVPITTNNSIFGTKPSTPVPNSGPIFGSKPSTPVPTGSSIFGSDPNIPAFSSTSVFGSIQNLPGGTVSLSSKPATPTFASISSAQDAAEPTKFSSSKPSTPIPTTAVGNIFGSKPGTPTPASANESSIKPGTTHPGLFSSTTALFASPSAEPASTPPNEESSEDTPTHGDMPITTTSSSNLQTPAFSLSSSASTSALGATISSTTNAPNVPSPVLTSNAFSSAANPPGSIFFSPSVTSGPVPVTAPFAVIQTAGSTPPIAASNAFAPANSPGGAFLSSATTSISSEQVTSTAPFSGLQSSTCTPVSSSSPFPGTPPTIVQSSFGGFAAKAAVPGGSLFGTAPATPPTTVQSSFGGFAAVPGGSLFGTAPTTESKGNQGFGGGFSSPAFGSSAGVFGSAPAYDGGGGGFGTGSVFGSAVSSAANVTSTSLFGTPVATTTNVFGGSSGFASTAESKSVFGGDAGGFGSKPATFGQGPFGGGFGTPQTSDASQPSAFGSGFFSGLGGQPSQDAANKNPFQVGANTEQSGNSASSSLFGNTGAKSFQASGQTQQPSAFGGAASGVGSQGFGGFSKPEKSGFGAVPAFGSAAAFGSPSAFGSTMGSQAFGSQSGSVFGQASSNTGETGGFASFAQNETPGFGNIASGGFGSPQQQQQQQPNAFGSGGFGGDTQKSPSFSGWR